jgi:hypothetical protein
MVLDVQKTGTAANAAEKTPSVNLKDCFFVQKTHLEIGFWCCGQKGERVRYGRGYF